MLRYLLIFTLLTSFLASKAQFKFERNDSIVVKHGTDTLDYPWAGGMNFCQFSRVDVDLDGKMDLLVFDRTYNQLLTFLNKGGVGQRKYKYAPEYEKLFPAGLTAWVLMRDYNCDGKADIFTWSPGGIAIYKNVSDTILKFTQVTSLLRGTQCTNYVNIYVISGDIPSIEDIDYDGDLDILTFGVFGTFLEYHRNYSVELGYGCDSLKFTMKNQGWGHFREDPAICRIFLNEEETNCAAMGTPEMSPYVGTYEETITITDPDTNQRSGYRHVGSTLLAIDLDGINSKDLLVTDVSCKNISALINGGAGPNLNSYMVSADTAFPNYDIPVNLDLFPAAYYLDLDNDNKRELVVAPNNTTLSDHDSGNWLYANNGTDTAPVFAWDHDAFMQDQMIERGENALPVFFDYNCDGKMDLVVSNHGFFTPGGTYTPRLALYENIGTASAPTYRLTNYDYASVFAAINKTSLFPTFGDLDGDGDEDMIIGDFDGNLHKFSNTSGPGNPSAFTLSTPLMVDNMGAIIDVGKHATPVLIDIDRDGDKDLIIGEQGANLNYYQNTGTAAAPVYKFITDNFGDVHVQEYWTPFGYSVPAFYDNGGDYVLFVGSQKGVIYQYDNIDGNLGGNFDLIDSLNYENKTGGRTGCVVGHLNNDARPDMITGNLRGGLSLYFGVDNTTGISSNSTIAEITNLYPNPATNQLNLTTSSGKALRYVITDVHGKILQSGQLRGFHHMLNIDALSHGMYFVTVIDDNGSRSSMRFIKSIK